MLNAKQLPLGLTLQPSCSFASFYVGTQQLVVDLLQSFAKGVGDELQLYLYGRGACGKSHLLQAACRAAAEQGRHAAYLPLAEPGLTPDVLQGLDQLDLVCLDQLDVIARQPAWEEALFHLINQLRARQRPLVLAAPVSPAELSVSLADLASRLTWGPVLQLRGLQAEELSQALQARCTALGLALQTGVLDYLLTRVPRDPGYLFQLINQLDRLSLATQRRLTIPLVKQHLDALAS